jgi:threonyl-tRNA synthetase
VFPHHGPGSKELWPDAKLGIGTYIEDGFYYDFDKK